MKILVSSLIAAVLATGCASDVTRLTIYTQPAGGYITEAGSGTSFGAGPINAIYNRAALTRRDSNGCVLVRGVKVQWVSGATNESPNPIALCGNGDNYSITVNRNPSDPGLDKDLEFALKLSTVAAQNAQARAARDAAAAQMLGILKAPSPINCTTTPIGNTINTRCQ